ncbi:MAG: DNA methyltransferase, partial [Rhodoferax sp.]|nr:DNA methyltransferase [Rhodoferax sp.]
PRVNVFLTNALEPAHAINPGLAFEAPMLAAEAAEANRVKEQLAATVVVGNPPYSGDSGNQGDWITQLMRTRLPDGADSYFRFNDADLGERNPKWVNNDYVKFIRLAQSRLATVGTGVLGFITSNSYLESPTFRGVRQSLLHSLPHLRIVDLHGNSKRGETAGGDENVFEITEGVAIVVGNLQPGLALQVEHADLIGPRQTKYDTLMAKGLQLLTPFAPSGERLQLVRSDSAGVAEYECGWPLTTIALVNSVGIVTARDALCIQFTEKQAWDTVRDFAKRDAEDARQVYALGTDAQDWQVTLAQKDLNDSGPNKKLIQPILYRPFDVRHSYYTGKASGFMVRPRPEVMRH